MSKQNNLQDFLKDVADSIRRKKGSAAKINPQNFAKEITSIQTASNVPPSPTISVRARGNDLY